MPEPSLKKLEIKKVSDTETRITPASTHNGFDSEEPTNPGVSVFEQTHADISDEEDDGDRDIDIDIEELIQELDWVSDDQEDEDTSPVPVTEFVDHETWFKQREELRKQKRQKETELKALTESNVSSENNFTETVGEKEGEIALYENTEDGLLEKGKFQIWVRKQVNHVTDIVDSIRKKLTREATEHSIAASDSSSIEASVLHERVAEAEDDVRAIESMEFAFKREVPHVLETQQQEKLRAIRAVLNGTHIDTVEGDVFFAQLENVGITDDYSELKELLDRPGPIAEENKRKTLNILERATRSYDSVENKTPEQLRLQTLTALEYELLAMANGGIVDTLEFDRKLPAMKEVLRSLGYTDAMLDSNTDHETSYDEVFGFVQGKIRESERTTPVESINADDGVDTNTLNTELKTGSPRVADTRTPVALWSEHGRKQQTVRQGVETKVAVPTSPDATNKAETQSQNIQEKAKERVLRNKQETRFDFQRGQTEQYRAKIENMIATLKFEEFSDTQKMRDMLDEVFKDVEDETLREQMVQILYDSIAGEFLTRVKEVVARQKEEEHIKKGTKGVNSLRKRLTNLIKEGVTGYGKGAGYGTTYALAGALVSQFLP
mgnify:FL=1